MTDIDVSVQLPSLVDKFSLEFVKSNMPDPFTTTHFLHIHAKSCAVLEDPRLQKIWRSRGEYDLVLTELFGDDCYAYFAWKLQVPLVSMTTSMLTPWSAERLGLPDNPSYIPSYLTNSNPEMCLTERLFNTVILLYSKSWYQWVYTRKTQECVEKAVGESLPPLHEVVANTSLLMVNSYHTLIQSRPLPPNVVEVGGIHIKPRQPLPKEFSQLLDGAKAGAILMSFGSLFRTSTLPPRVISSFLKVFAKIPQTVFLKFETDLPEAPPNVIVRKWLPIRDMMEHKNVVAVIQHGGLASTVEAVYFNKPLLGVPFFADQFNNIQNIVKRGGGVELSLENLNEETIGTALSELLHNPKYREGMAKLSREYRDRPMSGLQSAVFWTKYVIRQGPLYLRPASVNLPIYQYLLLDVAAVLGFSVLGALYCVYVVIKRVVRIVRVSGVENERKSKS